MADGFSLDQPLIGCQDLLLTHQRDRFNCQFFYGASVGRSGIPKVIEDTKSVLVHAAVEHGVCLEQREPRGPCKVGGLILFDSRFGFLLAQRQITALKQARRVIVPGRNTGRPCVLEGKHDKKQKKRKQPRGGTRRLPVA